MNFDRRKDNKWIFQKNISSSKLIKLFLSTLENVNDLTDYYSIKTKLKIASGYTGRSASGSENTMGVRLSQMCFYMFGYKGNNKFILSPMAQRILNNKDDIPKMILINLFSIQYPHPYSNTPDNFNIYAGRLIIKLLTEERLENKLYIDEMIWFLPFIEWIDEFRYEELINEILDFRHLDYYNKLTLFKSVNNYNDVFANVTHEFNYYFLRIFAGFNVLNIIPDKNHNNGKLFTFIHGKSTKRTDSYTSRADVSGFVRLNPNLFEQALKLNEFYGYFKSPTNKSDSLIFSQEDWIRTLYELEPLQYLSIIDDDFTIDKQIVNKINEMTHKSILGSKDGKEFEFALRDVFDIFVDIMKAEIISGSGETDIFCIFRNDNEISRFNVDAKTTLNRTSSLNPARLERHIKKTGAEYCLVVSPKYSKGVSLDIKNSKISIIEAETFATYISKEYFSNREHKAQFKFLHTIIKRNLGKKLDDEVLNYIEDIYGL